jgi:hypothetical protein
MEIVLVELEGLNLHEEVDPGVLRRLLHEIEDDEALWCPVIVDKESMVVLDGTHRVNALRILGCKYVCVYFVDYSDPEIGVERWFRAIPEHLPKERVEEVAKGLGMVLIPLDPSGVEGVSYPVLRLRDGSSFALAPRPDSMHCFDTLHSFERRLEATGYGINYYAETDASEKLTRSAVSAVLQPPALEKEQVVSSAVKGHVLPCKATRHVIPGRPVGVDVPLMLLKNHEINLEEANARLAALIERKTTENMPPGTLWRGRIYNEYTFIFADGFDQEMGSAPGYNNPTSTEFGRSLSREGHPYG